MTHCFVKVKKRMNFRDGHSCTSRCAPSRYCLMSGRYHFRRGHYHYKPQNLEYGRKVLPHIFKVTSLTFSQVDDVITDSSMTHHPSIFVKLKQSGITILQ